MNPDQKLQKYQVSEEKYLQEQKHKINPIELSWKNLTIEAEQSDPSQKGKKILKSIINKSQGIFRPGSFTAIQGPSGSGKTTLTNFLSGRLQSQNLIVRGELYLNGQSINDISEYSSQIAYVMQDDLLLGTQTPKEAFMFVANLRLPHLSYQERVQKVDDLISILGLKECENTQIGNELIRGISGGQRKRTSIGVELLTNPSMLFLDEPTTGLDSSTAQQLIQFLNRISQTQGVTIVSTIHQPSSETFAEFQKLILICRGSIIYQGNAQTAIDYFEEIGYQCPLYNNPSDFFMKLMNEEGLMIEKMQLGEELPDDDIIEKEFQDRLNLMISKYQNSDMTKQIKSEETSVIPKKNFKPANSFLQFCYIWKRSFQSQLRNNLDFKMKVIESLALAIACVIVFNNLGENTYAALQNRNGVVFYLTCELIFSAFFGSVGTFCIDKIMFIKERKNKTYGAGPYFWGKSLADQPLHTIYAVITVIFIYHAMGLNTEEDHKYPLTLGIFILSYWAASGYGLLMSVIAPSLEVAMALMEILLIPLLACGGYYINVNSTPVFLKWVDAISVFRWAFQAAALNEFEGQEFKCECVPYNPNDPQYLILQQETNSPDGTCIPIECDPLKQHGWSESLGLSILILFLLGFISRIIGFFGMYVLSKPQKVVLRSPLNDK